MINEHWVIALHGSLGNAQMLQTDMRNPRYVDAYFDMPLIARQDYHAQRILEYIKPLKSVIFLAYSMGCSVLGRVSRSATNIVGSCNYEGPLIRTDGIGGTFPVLFCWNIEGRWDSEEARDTTSTWQMSHPTINTNHQNPIGWYEPALWGKGGHTRKEWYRWPRVTRHNWDYSLNDTIYQLLQAHT